MNMLGAIGGFGGRQGQGDGVQQLLSEASRYQNNATIKADLQALQEAQQAGAAQGAPPPPPPPGMGMGMGMGRQGDNLSLSPEAMMIGAHQGPPPPPPGMGMGMGMGQMQGMNQMQGMGQMQGPPPPPPPNGQGQGQDKVATLIQQLAEDLQQVKSQQGGGF